MQSTVPASTIRRRSPDVPPIDPRRIDAAQRAGTRRRLTLEGVSEATADAWIEAWQAQAARDGLQRGAAYWDAAWAWIAAEREHRARP